MINVRRARSLAGAVLVVGLMGGCGQLTTQVNNLACDPTLEATGDAFEAAMTSMVTVSQGMRSSLAVACAGIATDLGMTPPDVSNSATLTDAAMQQACNMAAAAIKAAGMSTPIIEGGTCQVDAQAQFTCEQQCDVTHMCTTPTVVARCSPADLSGTCSGSCEAMAVCEGSATVAANCKGTCAATCTGTCTGGACVGTCDGTESSGPCATMCTGTCAGTCSGTCSGDCTLAANDSLNCGAEATCRGGCSVAYTAPVCEAALNPPSCQIDATCESACEGQGSLQATCTAPSVVLVTAGSPANAMLKTTLTKNLPAILQIIDQGKLVAQAAVNISTAAQTLSKTLAGATACEVVFGVEFATQVQASVAASTTIGLSVMASASVSASVVGG